jgi:two-component system, LytTR family, response regulator
MLRGVVIDDEESGIDTLRILAERSDDKVKIVASTVDPEKGVQLIEDYKPDILFLDISMPLMNGFELLDQLNFKEFKLVFTTAHRDYAIQAIKNKAFDYLLKPLDESDFNHCIRNVLKEEVPENVLANKGKPTCMIEIQVKDGIVYIRQSSIIRLEASRSYTVFYLDNGIRHVASRSLKEFEAQLDVHRFFRCHHSHLINLEKVDKFVSRDGLFALMCDGSLADIAKKNKETFLKKIKGI